MKIILYTPIQEIQLAKINIEIAALSFTILKDILLV